MHEVLVYRLGGINLLRKCLVSLTDRPDMTIAVYHGRKTSTQQQQQQYSFSFWHNTDRHVLKRLECYCYNMLAS